jgi:hypothetical protein
MGVLNSKIDENVYIHQSPQSKYFLVEPNKIFEKFKSRSTLESNPQPIPDSGYFISTVAAVRDAIIKHKNFSNGFREIMKTAVKNRVMGLEVRDMICVPNMKAVDVVKPSRKHHETHNEIISSFNRHRSQILNRQMLVKYTVL